jgi:putative ABC transport system permease protein
MMDEWVQSIRVGMRGLARTPGFTLTAILSLALGIGLSTAVFTVADALLLRRLPVRDQGDIVVLSGESKSAHFDNVPLGRTDAQVFARQSRSLQGVAFTSYYGATAMLVRDGERVQRVNRALVSGNFFDVLGAPPSLGRALRTDDDVRGAARVLVLSYRGWQQRFGGDSGVVGRRIVAHEDGVTYTIVGVMRQGLDYPRGTVFWAPIIANTPEKSESFIALHVIGRLAPGATPAVARDEMTTFFARIAPTTRQQDIHGVVRTLPMLVLGDTGPAILVFAAAAGLLLLMACMNVANLLMVRGQSRVREIAVRSALGAGRARIVMHLLTENVLLALFGGVLGVGVAAATVRAFVALAPPEVPRLDEIQLNAAMLGGAAGITFAATLIFALAPAVVSSGVPLQQVLRSDSRQSASRRSRWTMEGLVAGQVALALLVLSASGVITRSLINLERADLSFDASHLLIGELTLRYDRFDKPATQLALLEELMPRIAALPGVRSVSPVVAVPFSGSHGWDGSPTLDGQTPDEAAANPMLNMEVIAPSYFATFGIPVLRGRSFTDADREGAAGVVVLSQTAARQYSPHRDAIGRRLLMGSKLNEVFTVVGIVRDTRYRDLRDARATVYFPLRQSLFPFVPMTLAIRTTGAPSDLVPALRRTIAGSDPGAALASAAPFETFLARPLAQPRVNALLLTVFAGAAIVLAAVGLFGVMATMVSQRTRELGVRMALGATAADVRRMVMSRGLTIAAAGLLPGLIGALITNRMLSAMLYEVSATDGVTLAAVAALLLAVATLASFLPARASTRIDPVIAMRADG